MMRAIGSSYLIRQTPGSERIGGLQVTILSLQNGIGKIEVQTTDWQTRQAIEDDISPFVDAALKGIKDFAKQHSIDLSGCNLVLSNFLYHPIDSFTQCYYQAGRSAFRAALEARKIRDLD